MHRFDQLSQQLTKQRQFFVEEIADVKKTVKMKLKLWRGEEDWHSDEDDYCSLQQSI